MSGATFLGGLIAADRDSQPATYLGGLIAADSKPAMYLGGLIAPPPTSQNANTSPNTPFPAPTTTTSLPEAPAIRQVRERTNG